MVIKEQDWCPWILSQEGGGETVGLGLGLVINEAGLISHVKRVQKGGGGGGQHSLLVGSVSI